MSVFTDLNFWSALSGFLGTVLIFFFGLPSKINEKGTGSLLLEQIDEKEIKKSKIYKKLGYSGLGLIGLSFLFQLINLINN